MLSRRGSGVTVYTLDGDQMPAVSSLGRSCVELDRSGHYSGGGRLRCSQPLTVFFRKDTMRYNTGQGSETVRLQKMGMNWVRQQSHPGL